jgi:DNA-binding transcriptional LysR family regulator
LVQSGYREDELVQNRAPVLLYGGTEAERRAWAEEAAAAFPDEGPLREVHSSDELRQALLATRGVVFIPDVANLSFDEQSQIVRCLREREERPKFVVGVSGSPTTALEKGVFRDDLAYRLERSRVDLSADGVRELIRARREQAQKKAAAKPKKGSAGRR